MKLRTILLSFLLALASTLIAEAPAVDLPHVAITGFANRTGDTVFDIPSGTAADSLILTLKLLGSYRVLVPGEIAAPPAELTDAALGPWCETNGYDYCIYGAITRGSSGTQKYQLKVFDRARGKTTITENAKGESALDVFSISDELAGAVIDSVTGHHVAYGSVNFLVRGPIESCDAFLDGIPVGGNLDTLARLVTGTHRIIVRKKDAQDSAPLIDQKFEVTEEQATRVDVIIPTPDLATNDQNWIPYDLHKRLSASWCAVTEKTATVNGADRLEHVVTGRLIVYESYAGVLIKPGEKELERLRHADGITLRIRGDQQAYRISIETLDGSGVKTVYTKWVYLSKKDIELKLPFTAFVQENGRKKAFANNLITGITIGPAAWIEQSHPIPVSFAFTASDLNYF